jgi:DNA-binding NtrC family response regulator/tetratricopeptide (TPR) repeat protein
MTANSNPAEQLLQKGEFLKAADLLNRKAQLSELDRAIRSWIEFELGNPSDALKQANAIASQTSDPTCRVYALAVSGLALGRQGSPEKGIPLLRKALAEAGAHNPYLHATILGRYVNTVLSWVGIEPALPELPILRQLALDSGNGRALAAYHIAYARIAASRSLYSTAFCELMTASNLIAEHPDAYLAWRLGEAQASIALMDGNVDDAKFFMLKSLRASEEAGTKQRTIYTLGNLANIHALTGDFATARRLLKECATGLEPLNRARFAVWNIGIFVGLASNDTTLASAMVKEGERALETFGEGQSHYRLWFEHHRTRWLINAGQFERALAVATEAAREATRYAETELRERLLLLCAEVASNQRNEDEAKRLLIEASANLHNASLETLAEFFRVSALAIPNTKDECVSYLRTAFRLLTAAGLHGVRVDVERTARALNISLEPTRKSNSRLSAALVSMGIVIQLGRHPAAMGREIVAMLRSLQGCCEVFLEEQFEDCWRVVDSVSGNRELVGSMDDGNCITLPLGEPTSSRWRLRADKRITVQMAVVWTFLARLIAASRALKNVEHERLEPSPFQAPLPLIQNNMVAAGDQSLKLLDTVRKLASSSVTVLITGESGTGKELIARALHDLSPRRSKPFMPFNCGSASRELVDAQLFGYRRGAFTGAHESFSGAIRTASGGSLFLDEVGDMPLEVQPKLLRFLESGEIHPLGEPRPINVAVRVIAATNANLERMVSEGRFREDLFYRLNIVLLKVPPLRERREEIPPLVHHFVDKWSRETHKTGIRIADETMEYLVLYNWPGNIRQLANELRRLVTLAETNAVLMPEHLSHQIAVSRRTVPASERPLASTEVIVRVDQPMSAAMEHVERTMIQYALQQAGGRVEDAANRLGLSRKGLYLKRQRLHIDSPSDEHAVVSQ